MQTSLTLTSIGALFGTMVVLALVPSVSVLAVSARAAASGFRHGVFTTLGIVVGDIFFILVAILGLAVLAEAMGGLFVLVKYLGGAYLIGLGIALWRSKSKPVATKGMAEASLLSSFLTGLFITLGDQKAILFYLVFFPAFLDLSALSVFDTIVVVTIATVAVGGAKLVYAFMAAKSRVLVRSGTSRGIHIAAGGVMIAVGIFMLVQAYSPGVVP